MMHIEILVQRNMKKQASDFMLLWSGTNAQKIAKMLEHRVPLNQDSCWNVLCE